MKRRLLYGIFVFIFLMSNLRPASASAPGKLITPTPTPQTGALTARLAEAPDLNQFLPVDPIQVIFSEPMDPNSADPALLTYPYLPGTLEWSQNNTRLVFTPADGFPGGHSYHVFLDRDLKSAAGGQFEKIQQWQIQIMPAPQVLSHYPEGPNLVNLLPTIRVNFDRQMDPESVKNALRIEPAVDFTVTVKDSAANIDITQPLALGQTYRFTLDRSARDRWNVPLDQDASWEYWIPELRAEAEIKKDKEIQLKFNFPVVPDPSALPFTIDPPIAGSWKWRGLSVVFEAEQPLPYGTLFTIQANTPLKDNSGAPLLLAPVTVARGAPIIWAQPSLEESEAYLDDNVIAVGFAIPMDHAATEAAFRLSPSAEGYFEWDGNVMRYLLDKPLVGGARYTITLDSSARSADGTPVLLEPYSWSFFYWASYYSNQPQVSFGCEGGNAQVVDASGRRSIYFDHVDGLTGIVGFSLYKVDLPAFTRLYREYYRERGYYVTLEEKDQIPTRELERAAYWQEEVRSSIQETRIPSDLPTGLYVLTASLDGEIKDQIFIALTTNTLVVKQSNGRLWVWASNINGENIPDLEMRLYTRDGSLMREGKTDQEGIFETTLPVDSPPLLVAARAEGDNITIAGFDGAWSTNWWGRDLQQTADQKAYVYTDRPIYKPGHTIRFKAVLRLDDDVRYSLPKEGAPVRVRVLDPRENEVHIFDLQTNTFGTLNGEFSVAEGAGLGEYTIRAEVGAENARMLVGQVHFKVEDYRKPEFQVTVSTEKDRYIQGEQIKADIDTRYFFGEPVPNAQISIRTFSLASWSWWYDPEDDTQQDRRYTWYADKEPRNYKADEQGHYQYKTPALVPSDEDWYGGTCRRSWRSSLRRCTMAIEVTAKDASGQTVSGFRIVEIFNAAEKYTLDTGSWVKKPGEKFLVRARAVTLEGEKPLVNANLRLEVLGWSSWSYSRKVKEYALTTSENGDASLEIDLPTSGSYQLRLSPSETSANFVSTSSWIYVYSGADAWADDAWGSFKISAEQSHYKPYQKARLAIQSNFSGPALLTFERGRVIHQQAVMLTAPLTTVETEIIPEYAPNVFVIVNAWEPGDNQIPEDMLSDHYGFTPSSSTLRTARVELQVEGSQKALNISITSDQERYAPRQEANLEIQVTDARNTPVEAELSLALVDEAIFSLSDELAGPIFNAFYGPRTHSVRTSDSLAIQRGLGYMCGGRGGGGGGDISPANPRSDFPDTAVWLPVIQTDANGKATVKLLLPDSLTTWRVMVKAVTRNTLVGQAEARLQTHQEVIVQPVLPRALTAGDAFELGALVHNYTGQEGSFVVDLTGGLLEPLDDASQQVTLQAGEVGLVRWMVRAAKPGETEVMISAAQGDKRDAVRLPLSVRPRGMPEVDTQVGAFRHDITLTFVAPEAMLDVSTVEFKLSRSVAGSLLDGVDYLTGYPYGCVEQTMSRALPNAVVGRAFHVLGVENPREGKLDDMISAGVQRLYGFQHADGGWGWWHDDISTPYQTAWVVFGLSVTAESGYHVDEQVIERGAEYLKQELNSNGGTDMDLRTRAYVLYSLATAGYGDREQALSLAESAQELDTFSQSALALALHALGEEDAARPVLAAIERSARRTDGMAFWELRDYDGQYDEKSMASSVRSTALALDALVKIDPQNELIPDVARYLMSKRRAYGWGSTNETAFTILALTDHLLQLKETGEDANYSVQLNNQELSGGTLAWNAPLLSLQLKASQLKPGINTLRVTQTGDSPLFYTLTSRMILDTPEITAAGTVEVTRKYILAGTNKPAQDLKVGDLVRVQLTAKFPRGQASYVIIEDALPGGLEAVNERLNNSAHYGGRDYYSDDETYQFYWQTYGYNQKEIHAGRVSFFITEVDMQGSTYVVNYMARVTQAGDFLAPPAQVYGMYDETIWGRSASESLSVKIAE